MTPRLDVTPTTSPPCAFTDRRSTPSTAPPKRLKDLARQASSRDDVMGVIRYGGEKVFAVGADKQMQAMNHTAMTARARDLQDCFTAVARIPGADAMRTSPPNSATATPARPRSVVCPRSGTGR